MDTPKSGYLSQTPARGISCRATWAKGMEAERSTSEQTARC